MSESLDPREHIGVLPFFRSWHKLCILSNLDVRLKTFLMNLTCLPVLRDFLTPFVEKLTFDMTQLDGHLGGGFLNFWLKWVIKITKLCMQICSFWQNFRPLRPKMALIRGIIEIERAVFVLLALFRHMKRRCLGKAESEGTFLHTLLHSNTQKEDFWTRETSKSTHMSISVFVWFHSKVKYLCSLLYSSSSKEDFCKILLSSDEAVCMAAIPTLKGRLLSIFEWFSTNFTTIYIIID